MEVESKALVPKSGDAGPSSDAHNTWSPLHSTNVNILDLYSDHDTFNLDLVRVPHVEPNLPWFQRWPRMLSVRCGMLFNGPASWAFLFSLGVTCALVSFGVDVLVSHALRVRNHILDVNPALGLLLWVLWSIGMACGASAACQFISPHAQGSGIPELKTIMSGTVLKYCLSFRAGIAKALGLVLALAAGLVLGKEGPFVHLAGVICHKMCLLPCFKRLKASPLLKRQMLGAAVAAGVTAVYGTPVGGVLFSIEVTATYYLVRCRAPTRSCACPQLPHFAFPIAATCGAHSSVPRSASALLACSMRWRTTAWTCARLSMRLTWTGRCWHSHSSACLPVLLARPLSGSRHSSLTGACDRPG